MYALTVNDIDVKVLRFSAFHKAIRTDKICARVAKSLFRRNYSRIADICDRESCSANRARTIQATLESDVDAALRRAGLPGILKGFNSVDELLKDLK